MTINAKRTEVAGPYVNTIGARAFFGTPGKPKSRNWLDRQRTNPKFPKPFYFYGSDRPHWRVEALEQYATTCAEDSRAA